MSKHTPGPWYQNKANPLVICAPDGFADPWYVAEATTNCGHSEDQTEANARLIAAAPDLLEALVALDDDWTSDFPDGPDTQLKFVKFADETLAIWRKARAAIAKAKGEA